MKSIKNKKGEITMKNTKAKKNILSVSAAVLMACILVVAVAFCGCSGQTNVPTQAAAVETQAAVTQSPATDAPQAAVTEAVKEKQDNTAVTLDDAVSIALKDAGFTADEVQFTKKELDTDDGVQKYEVEFLNGGYEYEYDIDPTTGAILEKSKDLEND